MCEVSVRHEIEEMAVDDGGGHSLDGERRAVAHARGAAGRIMAKGVDLNAGGLVLNRGERVGFEFDGTGRAWFWTVRACCPVWRYGRGRWSVLFAGCLRRFWQRVLA